PRAARLVRRRPPPPGGPRRAARPGRRLARPLCVAPRADPAGLARAPRRPRRVRPRLGPAGPPPAPPPGRPPPPRPPPPAALFALKRSGVSRGVGRRFAAVSAVGLRIERAAVQEWLLRVGRADRWARVALIVGTGEQAERVIGALRRYPEAGWIIRGCVSA